MYVQEVVWWGYTAFVAAVAVFMLFFTWKVREGGE